MRQQRGSEWGTWVQWDDHVWQLHSQSDALYEGVVCGYQPRPLRSMAQIHLALVQNHLNRPDANVCLVSDFHMRSCHATTPIWHHYV